MTILEWHENVKTDSKMTLVITDMQKLFLTEKKSPWAEKKLLSIVPNIKRLIKSFGVQNTIFTRFMPPKNWEEEQGSWRTYYKINQEITTDFLGTDALEVIDDFDTYVSKAVVTDRRKSASVFMTSNFHSKIKKSRTQILIFTGIETDYCVLSSALDAIHLGYYVIVVMDACASSKKNGQKNAQGIFERFPEQLWITSTDELLSHLQPYQ